MRTREDVLDSVTYFVAEGLQYFEYQPTAESDANEVVHIGQETGEDDAQIITIRLDTDEEIEILVRRKEEA